MSKYFRPLPELDIDFTAIREKAETMTAEQFQQLEAEWAAQESTHVDMMRFADELERDGGRVAWDMSCSEEEFIRRVRAGEVV